MRAYARRDLFDDQLRVRMEAQLIELTFELLSAGRRCILDFGLSSRQERDALRLRARAQGVRVELHVLDIELDELIRRTAKRYADAPCSTVEISAERLAIWASSFETPSNAERCLFDSSRSVYALSGERERRGLRLAPSECRS